jgi:inosose dehydratase
MKVGCFALVDPFETLDHQLQRIADMGFEYADVTDNHPGGLLGREFGFAATVSLDDNPADVRRQFEAHGLTITSVCAHANLLDASAPGRYATEEIMKAVRLADGLGVDHVITTEGEPKTEWGRGLTLEEQLFVTTEKLREPVRLAAALDVELLLEPHGQLTTSIDHTRTLLDRLGHPETVGVNLDTGNAWLGGADPVAYAEAFADRIRHVHWKDLGTDWEAKRGEVHGCGMSPIALGDGVIDVAGVADVLADAPSLEYTTLEVAGDDNVERSYEFLRAHGAD